MKRDKRKNATELSVFIKIKEDGQYEIVDPCTDGEGIPVILFTSILNALGKAVESYNEKRKNKQNVSICPVCGASMNPARSLSPALVSGNLQSLWLYLLAPVLGAVSAVFVWKLLHAPSGKTA